MKSFIAIESRPKEDPAREVATERDAEGEEADGRARRVYFTERGQAAYDRIVEVLDEIELEWRERLGAEKFARLKELLGDAWVAGLGD